MTRVVIELLGQLKSDTICLNSELHSVGLSSSTSFQHDCNFCSQADMNVEMGKVNEKINRIEELMTNFISQLADKGLQTPADNLEV